MAVMEKSQRLEGLAELSQQDWIEALDAIAPAQHEVDRDATRIWFAFWPLELHEALTSAGDADAMARVMDLEGSWKLEEELDASVAFLYGARYWPAVKRAIVTDEGEPGSLQATIRDIARRVAAAEKADAGVVLGITAVGLMALRILGEDAFAAAAESPAKGELLSGSPDRIVARRKRESRDGLLTFLRGVNRRWDVRWDERRPDGVYRAFNTQDLAMAGASAEGDYRSLDYRRIDGPVPVECRVGSCGYCWVGVLEGRDKLSALTPFERERLRYFGYDAVNADGDANPLIRLACQSQCLGDVTLTIPPWNGELKRRHDKGRDELGTS